MSRVGDVLLAVFFGIFLDLALLALFWRSLARELNIRSVLGFSEAAVAGFVASLYPVLLFGVLWLIFLLLILLKNRLAGSRRFLQLGLGFLAAGVIGFFFGLAYPAVVSALPGDLRYALVNTADVVSGLMQLSGLICVVLAAIFVSVHLTVTFAGGRKQHE